MRRSPLLLAPLALCACITSAPPPADFSHGPAPVGAPDLVAPAEASFPEAWRGKTLALHDLFALADANSPAIAAAVARRDAAEAALEQAGLYPNPSLDTGARELPLASGASTDDSAAFAGVSQPVVVGKRRHRAVDAARARLAQADHALEDTRCNVLFEVYRAYVEILYFTQASELNRALLAEADALVRATADDPAANRRARVQADERALEVVRYAAEAVYAADRLERFLGGVRPSPDQIHGQLVVGIVPAALAVQELDAVERHPEVLALHAEVEAATLDARRLRAELTPDVTVRVGAAHVGDRDEALGEVGLSVPIPIWDRSQGAIAEAEARAREADARLREARDRLRSEFRIVVQQVNEWDTLSSEYARVIVPPAEAAYRDAVEKLARGEATMTDVLDAQREWFRLANTQLQYLLRLNVVHAQLWRLAGGRAEAFHDPQE